MEEYEKLKRMQGATIALLDAVNEVCDELAAPKAVQNGNVVIPYGEALRLVELLSVAAHAAATTLKEAVDEEKEIVDMFHRSDD